MLIPKSFVFLSVLLLLALANACESSTHLDIDAVIEEKVQERLDEFQRIIKLRCQIEVLNEAGEIADSIILREARLQKDTLDRPFRPDRPSEPVLKRLEDSLPLAPLFPDSIQLKPASSTLGG